MRDVYTWYVIIEPTILGTRIRTAENASWHAVSPKDFYTTCTRTVFIAQF
jgi:hypothetical protein